MVCVTTVPLRYYVMFMRETVYCLRKHTFNIYIETVEQRKCPSTKSFSFIYKKKNDKYTVVKQMIFIP